MANDFDRATPHVAPGVMPCDRHRSERGAGDHVDLGAVEVEAVDWDPGSQPEGGDQHQWDVRTQVVRDLLRQTVLELPVGAP